VNLEASDSYIQPTEPLALNRSDSLISLRTEAADDYAQVPVLRGSKFVRRSAEADDLPTIEELRKEVWVYSRRRAGPMDSNRIGPLPGTLEGRALKPVESRGRRRLLRIVRATPHSESVEVWPRTQAAVLLTEKSVCARKLRDFYEKGRVPRPDFLETPIVLPKAEGWRVRSRSVG
jgi:hypothetical protein